MKNSQLYSQSRSRAILVVSILLIHCTGVRFVSPYDAATDEKVTKLQTDTDAFLDKMAENDVSPAYTEVKDSYAGLRSEAAPVVQRNQLREKNSKTQKQLIELLAALRLLEDQHKKDGTEPKAFIMQSKESLDQIFRSIIKLEMARKDGTN